MLRFPKLPEDAWVRTCQECGLAQVTNNPNFSSNDRWKDKKCRHCHSQSLDFGMKNIQIDEESELED